MLGDRLKKKAVALGGYVLSDCRLKKLGQI